MVPCADAPPVRVLAFNSPAMFLPNCASANAVVTFRIYNSQGRSPALSPRVAPRGAKLNNAITTMTLSLPFASINGYNRLEGIPGF
jgi:hypothetical protein